jgi:hypothetical protein
MTAPFASMAASMPQLKDFFDPVPLAAQVANTPFIVYAVLLFSLAIAYMALWRTARDYRVFRNMGIYLAMCAVQVIWVYEGGGKSNWALIAVTGPVLVVIAGEALRVRNRRWTLLIWPFSLFVACAGWFRGFHFLRSWPVDASDLILVVLIVQCLRAGRRRDRPIAAAFAFFMCVRATLSEDVQAITHASGVVVIGGWRWAVTPPAIVLLGAATLVIYVRDLVEDRREKQRMASELAAGRAVQQVLVPESVPLIPGFEIQAVYKPFGEVGGDFFMILPLASGGMLAAIGDVSGKGMQAGMMVSLLVGALESLAVSTTEPAALLEGLNRCILGRSRGGFTTCLILRMAADGAVTMTNAGHLSPYRNGLELSCASGLPLGISEGVKYAETKFQLASGDRLTLLTDGVVEARDARGELLGFERMAALTAKQAAEIADAAQCWGQDDDITVVTVEKSREKGKENRE